MNCLAVLIYFTVIFLLESADSRVCKKKPKLRFPEYYSEGAVFQADQPAMLTGFTSRDDWFCPLQIERRCRRGNGAAADAVENVTVWHGSLEATHIRKYKYLWKVAFSAMPSGTECSISVQQERKSKARNWKWNVNFLKFSIRLCLIYFFRFQFARDCTFKYL